ncbi:hypothetical protein [Pedobacter aquatilis]|uniref:hypothetical protein n=1 Tax=Pedobacter aquatilis TaxID=351343 RepID=UPI002930130F|nr:hypothetical protein [Pedobacter aquatilis]
MFRLKLIIIFCFFAHMAMAQTLHLKKRKNNAIGGHEFAQKISDSTLSLKKREKIIFREIKRGNVPDFLRTLKNFITVSNHDPVKLSYYVLPDYLAIGSNEDFFYVPMTPMLAQKVAKLTHCVLPTKHLVDLIYQAARIKLNPQPIAPTAAMTTVPVFIAHTDSVIKQLKPFLAEHNESALTAGHKKDIIISNKIYGENTARVVIYGWHKSDGKAIQPVYNKHTNTWADYSHGVRLIQNTIYVDNKKTTLKKALKDPLLSRFFSDEGQITKPYYPVNAKY